MRLTVFGASGRTGRPLVDQAVARGHDVTAFVRDASSLPADLAVSVVEGDAYTGEGVPEAVAGADAVLSVLGHTAGSPDDLLTVAGSNVLAAMENADVHRYVTLVGAAVRTRDDEVTVGGRVMSGLLKLLRGEVLADAREHADYVRAAVCEWTVVRAPRLTDGAFTGEYRAGVSSLGMRDSISRADLAVFLLDCVEQDQYVRELPLVTSTR